MAGDGEGYATALDLTRTQRRSSHGFRRLSDKTENGDEEAYRELHKAVCDSFTEIVP
jgi:hypothetical protein